MGGRGPRRPSRLQGDAAAERRAREGHGEASPVLRWWRLIQATQSSADAISDERLDEVMASSHGWGFRECTEAITLIDVAVAGMQITSSVAGRLHSGIRLRQDALKAGLLAPHVPDGILIPYLGAHLQVHPSDLTDDLRQPVEPAF